MVPKLAWLATPATLAQHCNPAYEVAAVHELIAGAFVEAALSPGGRLLVIAPPRHGKSELCSHYGPAWYLQHFPERSIILAGYGDEFAGEWGERVRNTVSAFGRGVGSGVSGREARDNWNTPAGGGMRCVGIRGQVSGRGGHLLIADDMVKDAQDALSPTMQQRLWNWWLGTFSNRRALPTTSMIVIGTRWAEKDLLGRLLAAHAAGPDAEGYEPWKVLYLPAMYDGLDWTGREHMRDPLGRELGDALWPERWNREFLERERRRATWWFASLFQGRPQPLEGAVLRQSSWNYWRAPGEPENELVLEPVVVGTTEREAMELPELLGLPFCSVDCNFLADMKALAAGRERSEVAVHVWACDAKGRKFLLDRDTDIYDINETAEVIRAMMRRYQPGTPLALALGLKEGLGLPLIEAKANGPAVIAVLQRRGITCVPATPIEGKLVRVIGRGDTEAAAYGRAVSFAEDVKQGACYLPHPLLTIGGVRYTWVLDVRHRFAEFPRAGKDDTDAASQAWAKLFQRVLGAEDAERHGQQQTEAALLRQAGLRPGTPMPKNVAELKAAQRQQAIQEAEEATKRAYFGRHPNGGRRRRPW